MLEKDMMDVLVCGDFDDAQMEQLVKVSALCIP